MKPRSSTANKEVSKKMKKAGAPVDSVSWEAAMRDLDMQESRPEPQVDPGLLLDKFALAERQMTDLAETLEWFLFKTHIKIRNEFRDAFDDQWHYFFDLVRSMRGETAFLIARTDRESQGLEFEGFLKSPGACRRISSK
jgi:hypothetical protein